jgi:hypothetical protein
MTLFPLNATNTPPASGWTIMRQAGTVPSPAGWLLNGNCAASTATIVNRINMSGFSMFGVAQAITPLPIELLEFSGVNLGNHNQLKWVTSSERDNDYFTLERSSNGWDFETLSIVPGAGNSNTMLNYIQYDYSPYNPITYYRLKQTDYDGMSQTSHTIALTTNDESGIQFSNLFPNPSQESTSFSYLGDKKIDQLQIKLYNQTGQVVRIIDFNEISSNQVMTIDLSGLAMGVYNVHISSGSTQELKRLTVIK